MLRWGIPYYRLPENILDEEIRTILNLGIDIRYNKELGKDFTLLSLKRDGYEAIFLGIGAQKTSRMAIPGEDLPGVMTGLDLLARLAGTRRPTSATPSSSSEGEHGHGRRPQVRRTGSKRVIVAYRRTRAEMPAEAEIEEALEEGVEMMFLTAPLSINGENELSVLTMHEDGTRRARQERQAAACAVRKARSSTLPAPPSSAPSGRSSTTNVSPVTISRRNAAPSLRTPAQRRPPFPLSSPGETA